MSFRRLLDRTVTVVPRVVTGEDDRGNDVVTDGPPFVGVLAARDLITTDEEEVDRDQQNRRWLYFLDLTDSEGALIQVDGYARIIDAAEPDEPFGVLGEPELVTRRRRPHRAHHWELTAERRS